MGLAVFGERAQAMQHESRQTIVETTMQRWFGGLETSPELAQAMQYAEQQLSLVPVQTLLSSWQSLAQFSGYGELAAHLPATLLLTGSHDRSSSFKSKPNRGFPCFCGFLRLLARRCAKWIYRQKEHFYHWLHRHT